MSDLKARLKPLFRRSSTFSSTKSSASDSSSGNILAEGRSWSKSSLRLSKNRKPSLPLPVFEDRELLPPISPTTPLEISTKEGGHQTPATSPETPRTPPVAKQNPQVTLEAPTPTLKSRSTEVVETEGQSSEDSEHLAAPNARESVTSKHLDIANRRQSIIDKSQSNDVPGLLRSEGPQLRPPDTHNQLSHSRSIEMQRKRIWVKRPGSSPTQVMINEDDLVDDVRDMILRKYANSLGRSFDSPDVILRIIFRHPSGRHSQTERTLNPEESVFKVLELYYPGGQAVEEALVIDVPQRRTPKHSPHLALPYYLTEDVRPRENGTDYFPPMPAPGQRSPHLPTNVSVPNAPNSTHHTPAHAMAVLTTGQLPNLPSPGARAMRHSQHSQHRPKFNRQHTASPTVISGVPNGLSNHGEYTPEYDGRSKY